MFLTTDVAVERSKQTEMITLKIQIPDELSKGRSKNELESLAREALLVRMYDLGDLSSGKAAELLGMSRRAFLDLLGEYGVSVFDDTADLKTEAGYE